MRLDKKDYNHGEKYKIDLYISFSKNIFSSQSSVLKNENTDVNVTPILDIENINELFIIFHNTHSYSINMEVSLLFIGE